ncbi:MAG: permease-like cell division protein FtsX [bacterium]|nr:permease-like cell division protein FtsX [bacterium]
MAPKTPKDQKVEYFQLRRVLRSGLQNYWRNIGLSVATTFVTTLTLVAASLILLLNILTGVALQSVESKVDISVYFDPLASDEQVAGAQAEIRNIEGVSGVSIVSREEALERFRQAHVDNPLINASLGELDDNPLQTTLVIHADNPQAYATINDQLIGMVDGQVIDRVNYDDNRDSIERLSRLSIWAKTGGAAVGAILAGIAVLVVFNTVRLTIHSRREEVAIMKLVGATNGFVRGPFLIEGFLYGFAASLITIAIIQPLLLWIAPKVESFFGTSSQVFSFIQENLALVIAGEILVGVVLGVLSSYLAVHRYLKV